MEVSSLSFFLYFPITCLIILIWWTVRWRKYKSPPMCPGALPILGHSLTLLSYGNDYWGFLRNVLEHTRTLSNGEGISTMVLGKYTLYIIANPEECKKIANTCLKKHDIYKFSKPLLGDGLGTASVPVWKEHRRLLQPAMNQQILDGFLEVFNNESKRLLDKFEDKADQSRFDHLPYLKSFALNSVCSTTMGIQFDEKNSKLFDEFLTAFDDVLNIMTMRLAAYWLHNDFLYNLSSLKKQQDMLMSKINNLSNKIITEKEEEIKNKSKDISFDEKKKFKCHLEILLDMKHKNIFTHQTVIDEINTCIFGGYDTVAISITMTLVVLGSYPETQEKVYKELQEIFNGGNRDVKKEDISQMKYLEAVIKESIRLYPVAPVISRHIDKDIRIKDFTLSAGDGVLIPIYILNRHSSWGTDAEVFRPERWLDPSSLPEIGQAFATFSIGRRNCIGINYAMMIMKTVLAYILRQYKITADINKVQYEYTVTLNPTSGHYIKIEKRHAN